MPVVAVAAGAFAVGEIATVGIAAMSAFEVIAAVGAITSGIGALTGNEDLMKVGAIAGLAGGVGAFAQGKGWLATADAMKTTSDAAATSNIKALTQTTAPGVEGASNVTNSMGAGETAGLPTNSIASNVTMPAKNALFGSGTNDLGLGSITDSNIVGSPLTAGPGHASAPLPSGEGGWVKSLGTTELGARARDMRLDPSMGVQSGGNGVLSTLKDFSKFLNENKELASMAGNFLGGMFDEGKKAKAEADQAYADAIKRKMANGSAVPNMGFKTKPGSIWKADSPTYRGVSLWNAR